MVGVVDGREGGKAVSSGWRVRDNEAKNENQDNASVPPFTDSREEVITLVP